MYSDCNVLNLVINGLPSILKELHNYNKIGGVLNLVINGLPSIQIRVSPDMLDRYLVLNLVINGLPSIQKWGVSGIAACNSFKPCYKWITFNTYKL